MILDGESNSFGFFIGRVNVSASSYLIGGQDEDSCGKSGNGETPQECKRRGGSPTARGKRSLARNLIAVSQAVQLLYLIC
ncbi:hypothetical protein KM918_07590 [Priestia megaterium]|uniref:hypothetical protein n=1 Tax=Priestia megaterium TaxID=1404 RepID=UPI001C2431C0|nr:hypothetical protein [Priestia megaterium]MBU8687210.1 hypothetical protein [Priestia megaterium]